MINRTTCAICNSTLDNIYALSNMAVSLSCIDTPCLDKSTLSYAICHNCNTIQLDQLIPLNILYAESHNFISVGETWRNYFELFSTKISPIVEGKTVLEVGCPTGKIANQINTYKKWFIVEPNIDQTMVHKSNVFFIEKFFDDTFSIQEPVNVIVHSHLFEHIYDPNIFLKKCYDVLVENGEMFFGIPNMQHIVEQNLCPGFDVMFEHTIFYNKENILYLLEKHHFEVIEVVDYLNHSILFHVKKCSSNNFMGERIPLVTKVGVSDFEKSIQIYLDFIEKCKTQIEELSYKQNKVYLFGASYNTQLLLAMGLSDIHIDGILDNCLEKQNKYLFGYDIMIISPNILLDEPDSIVILKNGYYSTEISSQIRHINPNAVIII